VSHQSGNLDCLPGRLSSPIILSLCEVSSEGVDESGPHKEFTPLLGRCRAVAHDPGAMSGPPGHGGRSRPGPSRSPRCIIPALRRTSRRAWIAALTRPLRLVPVTRFAWRHSPRLMAARPPCITCLSGLMYWSHTRPCPGLDPRSYRSALQRSLNPRWHSELLRRDSHACLLRFWAWGACLSRHMAGIAPLQPTRRRLSLSSWPGHHPPLPQVSAA
jgi:hypothetical protein